MEQPTTGLDKEAFKALLELDEKERTIRNREGYYKAYVLSLLIPPVGIYYFFKYLFLGNGSSEDIKAGMLSLVITLVSLLLSIWLFSVLFKTTTNSITPQTNETLKELLTPAHQQELKNLLQ